MPTSVRQPVRVRLAREMPIVRSVWVPFGPTIPADFQLERAYSDWVERHVEEPLRTSLQGFLSDGHLRFELHPVGTLPAPPLDELRRARTGPEEEKRLVAATHEIVVTSVEPAAGPRLGFAALLAATRAFASGYHGVVMDRDQAWLVPVASYRDAVGPVPRARDFVTVFSPRRGHLSTSGLRKFQMPEVRVEDAPQNMLPALHVPLMALAQILIHRARKALGTDAAVPEVAIPAEMLLDLRHEALQRARFEAVTMPNAKRTTVLLLEQIRPPVPAMPYLRLVSPEGFRGTHAEWLRAMLDDLQGREEPKPEPPPSPEPVVATKPPVKSLSGEEGHRIAMEELPGLKERFKRGWPRGHQLYVRRAYPTREGRPEMMWIAVSGWHDGMLRGQLASVPRVRKDLVIGQTLQMQEEDVYDWLIRMEDGTEIGGFTVQAEERRLVR
ncbi:MAG: DUF2314 domain-containing protein [Armatimonadetes bacterium]|nr:DUF2314 domain-containing protein [Armatimonadota bacterium]